LEKLFEFKETEKVIQNKVIQQVTDSRLLPKDANIVVDCDRKIPLRFECIAKNQTSEFELTLNNYKWEALAKQANNYAQDALEREISLIENDDAKIDYYNFLADIDDKIYKAKDDVAFLRIGFGKGYYLNSLGIAIYDYVTRKGREELYQTFENFIKKQFAKQDIKLADFPKTRLFVTHTQEPLGWIKIQALSINRSTTI